MENIILFDVDGTLIDTSKLKNLRYRSLIKKIKISEKDHIEATQNYVKSLKSSTDFNPETYLKMLSGYCKTEFASLAEIYYDRRLYSECLFPDVLKVLEVLNKNYKLGIFSEGYKKFQNKKLFLSGIHDYFHKDNKYIFRRKTLDKNLIRIPKDAVIVDNNKEVMEILYSKGFRRLYWVNRKDNKNHKKIQTVFDLTSLQL